MLSIIQNQGPVTFPEFTGERVYMHPFMMREGLPPSLKRWQPTVDAMLRGVETDQPIYLMVDQSINRPGASQRRPGVHIDGYWNPGIRAHSGRHGGHKISAHGGRPPGHGGTPDPEPQPSHGAVPSGHVGYKPAERDVHGPRPTGQHMTSDWSQSDFREPEAIILASSIAASRALIGEYHGSIGIGGDCSHLDLSSLMPAYLEAGYAYAGNVAMLHESLPMPVATRRTLVRLNVPGWSPQ